MQQRTYGFGTIGVFFKTFKQLAEPVPTHGDRSLDGLMTFTVMDGYQLGDPLLANVLLVNN